MLNFANTVEYQNFGLNALTISAIATIIFSFIKGCGIVAQGTKIWKDKTGKSISPVFFFYNFFYFLLFLTYGIEEKSIAIIVSGLLCLLYLPIIIGLKKYRGFSKKEIGLIAIISLIIPASFIFSKSQTIFIFSIAAILAIFTQVKEVWSTKNFGAFSVRYLQTFLVATLFWGIYYATTKNWLLGALNNAEIILLTTALILEKKWRPKQK